MKLIILKNIKYFNKVVCSLHFIWYLPGEPDYNNWDELTEKEQNDIIKWDIAYKLNVKCTSWERKELNPEEIEDKLKEIEI